MLQLAEAIKVLDEVLANEADGMTLEPLYQKIPVALRGYVELVYDSNHHPSVRFIEGLLYKSPYYNTGMRRTELLSLHVSQMNFIRDEILLTKTKSGKPRLVPIHPNIRPLLQRLCNEAGPHGYLFENSKTGKPITTIKTA